MMLWFYLMHNYFPILLCALGRVHRWICNMIQALSSRTFGSFTHSELDIQGWRLDNEVVKTLSACHRESYRDVQMLILILVLHSIDPWSWVWSWEWFVTWFIVLLRALTAFSPTSLLTETIFGPCIQHRIACPPAAAIPSPLCPIHISFIALNTC